MIHSVRSNTTLLIENTEIINYRLSDLHMEKMLPFSVFSFSMAISSYTVKAIKHSLANEISVVKLLKKTVA